MKFGSLALACMVGSVASVQQTTDIYYQEREVLGEAMWTFGAEGVSMYSASGDLLKTLSKDVLPMCTSGEEGTCSFFDYASDGHKYVHAAAFGPNRVDMFDIDTGDYVSYVPTCSTPIDLDYHPNSFEMWIHCAGTDEANGHDGHIDSYSVNAISADFKQINLNVTGRAYGRSVVHSSLGNYGYASVYKQPYLYKMDLATREIAKKIEMPLTFGSYDMTYSPMNKHVYVRTRVTCTCGGENGDVESCGRGGPSKVDVLTGPNAGAVQVNGTSSSGCEGSKADTLGVYEYDTVTDELVASHNIKEGTGFGADPAASPDGKYIILMGNDGGQNLRVLQAGANGVASTIVADVPVEFEGGNAGQITISDFAFVTNDDKTVLVVAAGGDNNIVLVDMDSNPIVMRKLALTQASESTGGRSRAVEWAIGNEYVWINGEDSDEAYVVQIPNNDIQAAYVSKTLQSASAGQMLYVRNWERVNQKELLNEFLDEYFMGDPPASQPPASSFPSLCFSGENTVEVLDRGMVSMDSLKIGESVRVEGGEFSQVYSFGHYEKNTMYDYVEIRANGLKKALEISEDHMLYIQDGSAVKSVAARTVDVGDMIVSGNGNAIKIDNIKNVKRRGAYAPFTSSGNIVVSGVVASNYVSLMSEEETGLPVSMQWIAHTFNAPHRMICSLSFGICENEGYTNGVSNWVVGPLRAGQWLAKQSSMVKVAGSALLFSVLVVVSAIEMISPVMCVMAAGIAFLLHKKSQKKAL